jgi:hypothetical protein
MNKQTGGSMRRVLHVLARIAGIVLGLLAVGVPVAGAFYTVYASVVGFLGAATLEHYEALPGCAALAIVGGLFWLTFFVVGTIQAVSGERERHDRKR